MWAKIDSDGVDNGLLKVKDYRRRINAASTVVGLADDGFST